MKLGVCTTLGNSSIIKNVGYDFVELHVQRDLVTLEDDTIYATALDALQSSSLPCPVANCFIPGHLKLTGRGVDYKILENYVETTLKRAKMAGMDTIVFGSGGARRVPDGFSRDKAWQQLVDFGKLVGGIAENYEVLVVVEPLNKSECNILNTVGETAQYVMAVNQPFIRLLVDAYHWGVENEDYEDIVKYGPLVSHVHIATFPNRNPPGVDACDFRSFFTALHQIDYKGRISIEARWSDFPAEVITAYKTLTDYVNSIS